MFCLPQATTIATLAEDKPCVYYLLLSIVALRRHQSFLPTHIVYHSGHLTISDLDWTAYATTDQKSKHELSYTSKNPSEIFAKPLWLAVCAPHSRLIFLTNLARVAACQHDL